ncbi:MAG: hypothetical protein KKB37_11650 [Alphaproteobacteria bacterium]|nr:hypothetical protein [Alphaproteobacteria bacterium]
MASVAEQDAQPAGQVVDQAVGRAAPRASDSERTYYESGGGRKTFFALVFIILLPFFVSLPVMLAQRMIKGVWLDTWGLLVIAAGFTLIMVLVLFELVFSLRAKVDIGSQAVALTLPSQGGGLTPTLFYQSRTIPYEDIAAVQSYCDCYGGTMAPIVMRGARLVLKTGERIPLGFVNERDDDPRFPFRTIASQIADRAGLRVTDLGHVRYALHQRIFGLKSTEPATMPLSDVTEINRGHGWFLTILSASLAALLLLGIANDVWHASSDWGERSATETIARP